MDRIFGYTRRQVLADLGLLAVVPALLIAVHYGAPESARRALVLHHGRADPVSFLTAAYVHANGLHLRNNVLGYVAGALMAHLLCLQAGRRRWFHATLAALLVAVPVLVNVASHVLFSVRFGGPPPTTQGFSAVVAAVGGFVLVALLALLSAAYSRSVATFVGALLSLGLLTALYLSHASGIDPTLLAMIAGSGLLCVAALAVDAPHRVTADPADWRALAGEAVPVVLVAALLTSFVVGLFPEDVVRDGMVVNVYAHGAGFLLGAAFAALLVPIVPE